MTEEIIINGIDISECNYAILPKKQCPMKSMPYAKETSCIACKEHNTKLNFCKNNPNCYFKQRKRAEQKLKKIKETLIENCGYYANTQSCENSGCSKNYKKCVGYKILQIIEDK